MGWNAIERDIQRVDACCTRGGTLLLIELEDLNPYLSIDRLDESASNRFLLLFSDALDEAAI